MRHWSLRYAGWLLAKLALATVAVLALSLALSRSRQHATFDGVLVSFWIVPMLWVALVALSVRDQRLRCRTCVRRLRMPLREGKYSNLLLDPPGTEWVCPFGHGTLRLKVWISGSQAPQWRRHGGFWDELLKR